MSSPAEHQIATRQRRFGLLEALLVVAILAFGGFALMSDGRLTANDLLAGVNDTIGR